MILYTFLLLLLLAILRLLAHAEDKAEVNIRVSGACSPIYLKRRGIELNKYQPSIRFNPDKIQLIPKNPVVPGCVKIKAEGVEILKPVRNLLAEVEMRIGGTPDPNNPTLPCTKKIDDKVNQCPCTKTEGSCMFCDFCRQMRSQSSKISIGDVNAKPQGESLEESCKCEVMQPGLYDIETEMCTPELDDIKQFIPPEIQNNVLEKTPISMFVTVYLMDFQQNPNESYLSAFGKGILQRRLASSTIACFLLGLDVTVGGPSGGGDIVIEWLELPPDQRPYFLGMYFEQPDTAGHNNGTDSDQVKSSLIYIDAMVNYLLSRLDRKGYLGCINVVLVSDHGMQNLRPDENFILEEYFNVRDPNIYMHSGVISNIFYRNKSTVDIKEEIKPLKCQKGQRIYVHTPEAVPKRYHYGGSRVGEIILEASVGHIIYKTKKEAKTGHPKGDHGYDYIQSQMYASTFKQTMKHIKHLGPSIKKGLELTPFQNVELYNLFTDLMQLPFSAPNNGTRGVLYPLLKDPPDYDHTPTLDLPNCFGATLAKCGDGCHFKIQTEPQENSGCNRLERIQVPESLTEGKKLCIITFCNSTLVFDRDLRQAKFAESLLFGSIPNIDHRASCTWHIKFANSAKSKSQEHGTEIDLQHIIQRPSIPLETTEAANCTGSSSANTSWVSLFSDNDYSRYIVEGQIQAPRGFVSGIYKEFIKLLQKYRRHYKQLIMFSGPIFDSDLNGLKDSDQQIIEAKNRPTHIFFILIRCKGEWHRSLRYCEKVEQTRVMSFILPLLDEDLNCLYPLEYILRHSARVRDIELLTGIEFFLDRSIYSNKLAIQLRTQHVESLWQMEQTVQQ